jgi:DNA-binding transcriptional LysR family regulator
MISTDLYESFIAIYRCGSVSAAARQRHLTQSAVSQQLATLENLAGGLLFRRSVKGMIPTALGKSLYDRVFDSVDRLNRVSRSILRREDPSWAHGEGHEPFRLGTSADYFDLFVLERVAEAKLQLAVTFGDPKELLAQLQTGMLDAVISVAKPSVRALQYRVLAEKRFLLVGPAALRPPRAINSLKTLASWLKTQPWIGYSVELPNTRRFWQQVLQTRFESTLALVVADLRTVLRAVQLGLGVTILPEYICAAALQNGRIRELWPIPKFVAEEQWILSYRELDADRPSILQLAELLGENEPTRSLSDLPRSG